MTPSNNPLEHANPTYASLTSQVERLGNRDPIKVLAETPFALAKIIGEHSKDDLRRRPAPDKWSAVEIIGHLCDIDWVLGCRARTIAFDKEPRFLGMDQDLWVAKQDHRSREAVELLELFRGTRRGIVDFWRRRSPEEMARTGRHQEAGIEISLSLLLQIQAGHDLTHLDQIAASLQS